MCGELLYELNCCVKFIQVLMKKMLFPIQMARVEIYILDSVRNRGAAALKSMLKFCLGAAVSYFDWISL